MFACWDKYKYRHSYMGIAWERGWSTGREEVEE